VGRKRGFQKKMHAQMKSATVEEGKGNIGKKTGWRMPPEDKKHG